MNKKLIFKILITIFVLLLLYLSYRYFNQPKGAKYDGTITIIVINKENEEVIYDDIEYQAKKADGTMNTLFDILNDHYQLTCLNAQNYQPDTTCGPQSNGINGKIILSINDVQTDWNNHYLAIYINGVYSNRGVSQIEFKDGDVIEFKYKTTG